MKCFGAVLLIFAAVFFLPSSARADLDQHCLKQCVESGLPSSACMTQCSYNIPVIDPTLKQPPQTHRVLPTLTPMDEGTVILPHKPTPPPTNKDYSCMANCLKDGGSVYSMCEEHCATATCPPGSSLCRNPQTGMSTPNAPIPPPTPAVAH